MDALVRRKSAQESGENNKTKRQNNVELTQKRDTKTRQGKH